ncbi:MAG: fluoride efflux transporter CrcB [Pyrinomonadaceae bacterium]
METLTKILSVAVGGAIGALARYGLNLLFAKTFAPFPFATFFINITGSFLIGFLLIFFQDKFPANENLRLLIIVGFLGAYTTFSTFEFETFELLQAKQSLLAILYVSLSFAVGLTAVCSGALMARRLI